MSFSPLLLAVAIQAPQASEPGKPPAPDVAVFVQSLDSLRREAGIPGLSAAVLKDGALVLAVGLGYADAERKITATAETPYNIASVTKPISAVVALKLVEEGRLHLDRPIARSSDWAEFCAEFSRQPSIFARGLECEPAVHTLRHLLSHTATGRPGRRFSYNPVIFSWASRPMMQASGAPFSSLVERYVFQPAGMKRSARIHRDLPLREDLAIALAPPHRTDETGAVVRAPDPPPQGDGAGGGVISTVIDLAKFDVALDDGAVISRASRDLMMTPTRSPAGAVLPYGLGWFVQEYGGRTLVWHSGWWEDAYSALYLKVPAERLTLILLANHEGIWWDNPLDEAAVEKSAFAQAFFRAFLEP